MHIIKIKSSSLLILLLLSATIIFFQPASLSSVYAQAVNSSVIEEQRVDGIVIHKFTWLDYLALAAAPIFDPDGAIVNSEVYVYELDADQISVFKEISEEIISTFEDYEKIVDGSDGLSKEVLMQLPLQWQIGLVQKSNVSDDMLNWHPIELSELQNANTKQKIKDLLSLGSQMENNDKVWLGSNKPISNVSKIGNYWVSAKEWNGYVDTNPSIAWINCHQSFDCVVNNVAMAQQLQSE